MKTQAAQAAALIRKEIKAAYPGLKFTCKSDNYSMGSSINVAMEDQPREVRDGVEEIAKKYQYGHFDGMTDMYEHSNSRDDIPQAKHVFVENRMTQEKREEIYQQIKRQWAGGDMLPNTYAEAQSVRFHDRWMDQFVWQVFNGSMA